MASQNPSRWRPRSLKRKNICINAAVLVAVITALALLETFSRRNDGLAPASIELHYLWTYGPTASGFTQSKPGRKLTLSVLTWIAAFWQRVDYRSKQLAPWVRMSKGPSRAQNSVLLDYVSEFLPVVLWRSLRDKDWPVLTGCVGSLLYQLLIILSTGLLVLQPTLVRYETTVTLRNSFDGTNANAKLAVVAGMPLFIDHGAQNLNLSYPRRTTDKYMAQSFDSGDSSSVGSTVTAQVDLFEADFGCEKADLHMIEWIFRRYIYGEFGIISADSNFSVSVDDCQLNNLTFGLSTPGNGEEYLWQMSPGFCAQDKDDYRVAIVFLRLYGSGETNSTIQVLESATLMCKPTYSIRTASVTFGDPETGNDDSLFVNDVVGEPRKLPGLNDTGIFGVFRASLIQAQLYQPSIPHNSDDYLMGWLTTRGDSANPTAQLELSAYLNTDFLKTSVETFYKAVGAQIASEALLVPSESQTDGVVEAVQDRLVVQRLALILMEATVAVLLILTLLMGFLAPRESMLPQDPGAVAGSAVIFAKSPQTAGLLSSASQQDRKSLELQLSSTVFELTPLTSASSSVSIKHESKNFKQAATGKGSSKCCSGCWGWLTGFCFQRSKKAKKPTRTWYRPWINRWPSVCAFVITQAAFVAVLEVLLDRSKKLDGIVELRAGTTAQYAWSYVPALLMTLTAMYYNSIYFNVVLFAPFSALKRGIQSCEALSCTMLGTLAVVATAKAVRLRSHGVIFICIGAITGSFLTIAVAGVFFLKETQHERPVEVQLADYFSSYEFVGTCSSTECQLLNQLNTGTAVGVIAKNQQSFPPWTYEDLAFPRFGIVEDGQALHNDSLLRAYVPAIRPKLDCFHLTSDAMTNVTIEDVSNGYEVPMSLVSWSLAGADWDRICPGTPKNYAEIVVQSDGNFGRVSTTDVSCPNVIVWGSMDNGTIKHLSSFSCRETLEQVMVDVTFNLPNFTVNLDGGSLSVVDEDSATFFTIPARLVQGTPAGGLPISSFETCKEIHATASRCTTRDQGFFAVLATARPPKFSIPPISAWGDPVNDEVMIEAVKWLWKIVRTQEYNYEGRIDSVPQNVTTTRFNATGIDSHRTRLHQSPVSTRILESLLMAMTLCVLASTFLVDTKNVLQVNPCSIAGMAALLAGSELLLLEDGDGRKGAMPPGDDAQKLTGKQLREWWEAGRWQFKLGWFGEEPGQQGQSSDEVVVLTKTTGSDATSSGSETIRRRYRIGVAEGDVEANRVTKPTMDRVIGGDMVANRDDEVNENVELNGRDNEANENTEVNRDYEVNERMEVNRDDEVNENVEVNRYDEDNGNTEANVAGEPTQSINTKTNIEASRKIVANTDDEADRGNKIEREVESTKEEVEGNREVEVKEEVEANNRDADTGEAVEADGRQAK